MIIIIKILLHLQKLKLGNLVACLTRYKRLDSKKKTSEREIFLMIKLEQFKHAPPPFWEVKVNGGPPTSHMEIHMTPPPTF